MMHGHQFDRRNAQLQQVADRRVGGERFVRAADLLGQP